MAEESESTRKHKAESERRVTFGVLVISTSVAEGRNTDRSGALIREMIVAAGHQVAEFGVVPDESRAISEAVIGMARRPEITAIVSTGGTGLTKTDVTIETLRPLFLKEISGFLPLFMQLGFEDVGAACMLSRATAGIIEGPAVVFALPGSPKACRLALERLILPEAAHIVKHFGEQ